MDLEYGTITSVIKNEEQNLSCHVKSNISDAEYKFCDIVSPKGYISVPEVGNVVLLSRIHNGEVVIIAVLSAIKINEGEIEIKNTAGASILLKADGSIDITATTVNVI